MLDKNDEMNSIKEQCDLLGLNRTSIYYKPKPVSREKLLILNRIYEIYTIDPAFGGATIGTILQREGYKISNPTIWKYMGKMGLQAIYTGLNLSKRVLEHKIYHLL